MSSFYGGSRILEPLVPYVGLSVDKINFIVCQAVAIVLGPLFQLALPASSPAGISRRYFVSALLGTGLCIFCFGYQILHLVAQAGICLLLMRHAPQSHARFIVCGFAMLYLSWCHIMRLWYDPGGFELDITGPLMIQTQRLSSLAFNLHDGEVALRGDDGEKTKLTLGMRKHLVRESPSLLQYASYTLHFQGIMVGPFIFYSDFKNFIEGTIPKPVGVEPEQHRRNLLGIGRIFRVSLWVIVFTVITLNLPSRLPMDYLVTDSCEGLPFVGKWLYLMASCFVIRQRYYFAWSLGELAYLTSGCGFSGVNPSTGQPEYNVVKNFDFTGVELATSSKVAIDNWNIGTVHWLRECIYERAPAKYATLSVFTASAAWHGFYPGYYFMFVSVSFFTNVARNFRRRFRPLFVDSAPVKAAYDVVTGVSALTTLNYCAVPFVLLELSDLFRFWRSMYFFVHVSAVALFAVCSLLPMRQRPRSDLTAAGASAPAAAAVAAAAAAPVSRRD